MHKDQTCESTELNRQFDATQIMKSFCTFRFPMPGDETAYIVCVADNPRIHYCGDNSLFDPQTLSCLNYQVISQCHSVLIAMPMSTYFVLIAARAPDRPSRPSSPLPVQPIRQIIGAQLDPSYLFIYFNLFIQPLPLFLLNSPIKHLCCCFSRHKYDFRSFIFGFFLPVNWWILIVLKSNTIRTIHALSTKDITNLSLLPEMRISFPLKDKAVTFPLCSSKELC